MSETSFDPLAYVPNTFDAWVPWLFDRPVVGTEYWFWDGDHNADSIGPATRTLDFIISLFGNSAFLLEKYSERQIDQGLWRLLQFLSSWLDSHALDLQNRIRAIQLVPTLYRDSLGQIECEDCYTSYMWWDVLRFVAGEGLQPAAPPLTDSMRAAMVAMLESDSVRTVAAAIHGLAHLMNGTGDVGAREALEGFQRQLESAGHPDLREDVDRALSGHLL